ncbi:hypothetical protein AB0E63_17510 [Kribbella sp. NPDC026596]|uniref:hypothetical protein n=1 Tax=Kribbella sp. NPDC026596 TaxID=3155122 RepID=UPI0033C5723C
MQLTTFEPGDWDGPTTAVLRPRPWYAHILDLRDPDTDRLSPQFLGGLTQLADCYRDMQARLVLTVRADLWRAVAGQPIAGIHVLRLDEAPDSLSLIERRIKQSAAALVPHLNDPKVKPHLQELSAVQAAEAAQTILHEWALLSVKEDEAEWCDHLAKVLDNHTGELNGLFVPSETPSQAELLSNDDRCLLIALGCLRSVQLAELDSVSKSLSAYLQRIAQPRDDGKVSAYEALGGPGLRGRIDRIKARVRPGEIVAFKQSAFGDAAVRYVWDNYPTSRPPIAEWLIRLAVKDAGRQQVAKEWLSELVRRHQDVDFIKKKMQKLAIEQDCPWLLADVLYDGAKDPHMRRRCERVLYDWALNEELQGVVVAVAERLLLDGERSEIAVRRLQRVADETSKEEISVSVLAAFEAALQHPGARTQFIASAAAWLKQDASKPSAKLALRALVSADAGSLPWLLSEQAAEIDLQLVLGEALADDITHDAILTILAKASLDETHYARVVDAVAAAAVQQGAGMALYRLLARFGGQDRFSGRDPEGDIQSKVKLVAAGDTAPPEAHTVI